jgi:hypothetical protein
MLIPKQRLHLENRDGQQYCVTKYYVWDTDDCGYKIKLSLSTTRKKNVRSRLIYSIHSTS